LHIKTLEPYDQFFKDELIKHPHGFGLKNSIDRSKEQEDERSINDVVALFDFPWQHPPEEYSVAITGRAFNHLLHNPN
jgi:hypothetical protein